MDFEFLAFFMLSISSLFTFIHFGCRALQSPEMVPKSSKMMLEIENERLAGLKFLGFSQAEMMTIRDGTLKLLCSAEILARVQSNQVSQITLRAALARVLRGIFGHLCSAYGAKFSANLVPRLAFGISAQKPPFSDAFFKLSTHCLLWRFCTPYFPCKCSCKFFVESKEGKV